MGAVHMQTQMLTAPSAVVAEQTLGGLVEHSEQSRTVDIPNPDGRHNFLANAGRLLLPKSARDPLTSRWKPVASALERRLRGVVSGHFAARLREAHSQPMPSPSRSSPEE